ncbi:hypothetical protein GCM10017557_32990 [Streptomyces aurantiacus]|uniref:Uncharacterized protein n=1 Tax=Streptomyces aurantiacus TaxID=47760 RepID=A0A7G1P3M3_9ACTN|nr:hypothetical protein GCM10017557_32990 [Streptomyces aurantiacus]
MHDVPSLGLPYTLRELLGLGPYLLEAQHVGGRLRQPFHEALLGGGTEPVHIHRGHSQHPGTIPAHWTSTPSLPTYCTEAR